MTEVRRRAATSGGLCEFVIRQIDTATVSRVAVKGVPLPVNDCVRNAGVAASEGRALVVRAGRAKVCKGQVGKVKMPRRVHAGFRITAAVARRDLAFKSRGTDDPFEGFASVEGVPDPTGIGGKRAGGAGVKTVRI